MITDLGADPVSGQLTLLPLATLVFTVQANAAAPAPEPETHHAPAAAPEPDPTLPSMPMMDDRTPEERLLGAVEESRKRQADNKIKLTEVESCTGPVTSPDSRTTINCARVRNPNPLPRFSILVDLS